MTLLKLLLFLTLSFELHAKPCKNIIQAFLELYPHHDKEMILTRLQNAKNKHKFMRGFIPYYYQEAYEARKIIPVHKKLHGTTGQIVGDAHVENFGFMINNDGKPILALNDFDDVADAPLYLDVMRLSQSASYIEDIKQAKLIAAYKKGLQNSDYKFSGYIEKLKDKSKAGGVTSKADYTKTENGLRFTEKDLPISESEIAEVTKILKEKFGAGFRLHDSYKTMKASGGSAYGNRFHVLAEFDNKIHFIELKEIFDSGVVGKFAKVVTNEERILSARNTFLGDNFDNKLDVVKVDKTSFQLRFKSEGNKSIDFAKVDEKEVHKVIEDEFFVLGQLHRKSLNNSTKDVKSYVKDLDSVTTEEWEDSVKIMKEKIKKAFDKSKE